MVLDSSAIIAILLREPERFRFLDLIDQSDTVLLSAATALETAIVIEHRRGPVGANELDIFLQRAAIQIVSVDTEQLAIARHAWRKYGKGRHPAALNLGDCFVYGLTKVSNEPLLAKGSDFRKTDLQLL